MLRFIKFGWSVSVVSALAVLLYVYAGLPQLVIYNFDSSFLSKTVDKEVFFYISLGFLAIVNFISFAISKNINYRQEGIKELLKKWVLSFALVLNIFYIIIMNMVFLINSQEKFDFDHFGWLVYLSLGLLFVWILALPFLIIRAIARFKKN